MNVFVGIATTGRASVLSVAIQHIATQTLRPVEVVVCTPDIEKTDLSSMALASAVTHLESPKGSCAQRNAILDYFEDRDGVVLFLDDDFFLHPDYLRQISLLMTRHPDVALVNGTILKDGIVGPGLSAEEANRLLSRAEQEGVATATVVDRGSAYGCNMAVRLAHARTIRFDENLPLYGWQEDVDFSFRLKPFGRIAQTDAVSGVHLGVKTGRTSGVRFGYSQVVNPLYLIRKGTMSAGHVAWLLGKNIGMNLLRSIRPEPYIDRRGRLKGNLLGLLDCVSARIDPRRVVSLD